MSWVHHPQNIIGTRCSARSCLTDFLAKLLRTNSSRPKSVPKINSPWSSGFNSASLLHTMASGSTAFAATVKSTHPTRATPALFHNWVLPWWIWMLVWTNSSSCIVVCTVAMRFRDGLHTKLSSKNAKNLSSGLNRAWIPTNASRWPRAKNSGIRASPCSPPSLLQKNKQRHHCPPTNKWIWRAVNHTIPMTLNTAWNLKTTALPLDTTTPRHCCSPIPVQPFCVLFSNSSRIPGAVKETINLSRVMRHK